MSLHNHQQFSGQVAATGEESQVLPGSWAPAIYGFEPSARRAEFLDQRMRSELGGTLRYLFGELEAHFPFDPASLTSFLHRLETAPTSPLTFAIYGDLVLAIDRNELAQARQLTDALLSQPAQPGNFRILSLGEGMSDEEADRYVRYVNTDPEMPLDLSPPSTPSADYSRKRIEEAFALMESGDPDLAAEVRALLREIILCAGSEDPTKHTFDGASSLLLWGGILINADRRGDELAMVQMLAHESAHNLLFGLAADKELLNNDSDERYSSPLRDDPRPLEGIYHATFVLARMHRSIKCLLDRGVLSEAQANQGRINLVRNARSFFDSIKTLDNHADMTEKGAAIIEGARAYMLSV